MQPSPTVVASRTDQASLNIAQNLIQQHGFQPQSPTGPWEEYRKQNLRLLIINKELIHTRPEDIPADSSCLVFVSKHRSSTETPALTVHATGNLTTEASFGGNPEEVSMVEPSRIQSALQALHRGVKDSKLEISVTMEATHHGPTNFPVPVCFVEIGSSPAQYQDLVLGGIVAEATMAALSAPKSSTKNAVGFGGTHYPAKHTQLCLEGTHTIGHIVSRHALDYGVSDRVLESTFQKTQSSCTTAIIDWKGLKGEQRRHLLDTLASWRIEPVRA